MHQLPRYLKHTSGQARVVINGKAFYLGRYGSQASKQRYDALIAEYTASNRSPTFGMESGDVLMQDLMLAYLRHARQYFGTDPSSELHRIKDALKPLDHLYGRLPVGEFGPQQFKAVRQRMIEHHDWARTTINRAMKRICRMVKWGAFEGMYPAAIYDTLKLIPGLQRGRTEARETEPVKPVSEAVMAATIKHCSPVVADMIRVQMLTGCRPGELCKLTPAMIDRTGEVWEAKLEKHKTAHHGKDRILYFGPDAQQILLPYLLRHEDACLFSPLESEKLRRRQIERRTPLNQGNRAGYGKQSRHGKASGRKVGTQYNTQSYGKAIAYACDRAFPAPKGLGDAEKIEWRKAHRWSPNQIRHTRATELRAKHGIEITAVMLGHSKVETSQIYAEQNRAKAIAVAKQTG